MRKDEAAFPQPGYGQWEPLPGMTLRDYFAAKAMTAMNINPGFDHNSQSDIARLAYEQADAMIDAREVSK